MGWMGWMGWLDRFVRIYIDWIHWPTHKPVLLLRSDSVCDNDKKKTILKLIHNFIRYTHFSKLIDN